MAEERDLFRLSEEEFKGYLGGLTPETVISAEAFTAALAVEEPFLKQQRLELLRQKAKLLGVSGKNFESLRAAFDRGLRERRKKNREHKFRRAELMEQGELSGLSGDPVWYAEGRLNETAFCEAFREEYEELRCIGGQFYSVGGMLREGEVCRAIQEELSPYFSSRLAAKTTDLLRALKNACYAQAQAPEEDRIHVQGGYVDLSGEFHPHLRFCMNRLDVEYDREAKPPRLWLDYLNSLLEPEDVRTLQEYLGYCLIPSTRAEKMLFLIGSGGEGKSVLGAVMAGLFGNAAVFGSLHDLETNRFALADLESRLLFIDDDLSVNACPESKTQKSLVTAKAPLRLERKGQQSYNAPMYCRLLAFGNVPFTTLYDHSEGAFRRRIILTTRPRPDGRQDDRNLSEELLREKPGIFNWMLEGLYRLIGRNWEFTVSERARENLEESRRESFNLLDFLEDGEALRLGNPEDRITSRDFCTAYERWCYRNEKAPLKPKTVTAYLRQNAGRYGVRYNKHITDPGGGQVRGFEGVRLLDRNLIYREGV